MKKYQYKDYAGIVNFDAIQPLKDSPKEIVEFEDVQKESLLRMIFDINPENGLPANDIGIVLNKHASPEVLQFIKDNLMSDVSSSAVFPIRDGVDEDTAFALMRGQNESRNDYIYRVRNFLDNEKRAISAFRDLQKKQPSSVSEDKG